MVILSRRVLCPFLAPSLGYSVFSAVPPNPIRPVRPRPFYWLPHLPEDLCIVCPGSGREP